MPADQDEERTVYDDIGEWLHGGAFALGLLAMMDEVLAEAVAVLACHGVKVDLRGKLTQDNLAASAEELRAQAVAVRTALHAANPGGWAHAATFAASVIQGLGDLADALAAPGGAGDAAATVNERARAAIAAWQLIMTAGRMRDEQARLTRPYYRL